MKYIYYIYHAFCCLIYWSTCLNVLIYDAAFMRLQWIKMRAEIVATNINKICFLIANMEFFVFWFDLKSKRWLKNEEIQQIQAKSSNCLNYYQWSEWSAFCSVFSVKTIILKCFETFDPFTNCDITIWKSFLLFTSASILCPFALQSELPGNGTVQTQNRSLLDTRQKKDLIHQKPDFHFTLSSCTYVIFFHTFYLLAIVSLPVVFIVRVCVRECACLDVGRYNFRHVFCLDTPPQIFIVKRQPTTAISLIKTI